MVTYSKRASGISHIATILSELAPSIYENKLIPLTEELEEICHIQKLGLMLERADVLEDEEKKEQIFTKYCANDESHLTIDVAIYWGRESW